MGEILSLIIFYIMNALSKQKFKTIVISDVHLGSRWSKTKEAIRFLKNHPCEKLILCGDIIDGWAIMRGKSAKWKRRHSDFVKTILDLSHSTEIIYVRGNHDDFLDTMAPISFLNISVVKDYIHESYGKRYYVLHGDVFDKVTHSMRWLAKVGDIGYEFLLYVNRIYNHRRIKKGLPYDSLAQKVKSKVKASVSYISDFETHISSISKYRKCDGVICGHIHHPEIKTIGNTVYLNSVDWVESLSALLEDEYGNWKIYKYAN